MNTYILDAEKLKQGSLLCLEWFGREIPKEEIISKYKDKKITIHYGESYIYFDWYYDERTDSVKEKTKYWKYKNNEYQLQAGEFVEANSNEVSYIEKPISDKPQKWNAEKRKWEIDEDELKRIEEQKQKELAENYFSIIDQLKDEVLSDGFDFNGHKQKCRNKDLIYLTSTIMSLSNYKKLTGKDMKAIWAFSDTDAIEMSLQELEMLQLTGTPFIEKVYAVEKIFKKTKPFKITKNDFLGMLEKVTLADDNIKQKHIEVLENNVI